VGGNISKVERRNKILSNSLGGNHTKSKWLKKSTGSVENGGEGEYRNISLKDILMSLRREETQHILPGTRKARKKGSY